MVLKKRINNSSPWVDFEICSSTAIMHVKKERVLDGNCSSKTTMFDGSKDLRLLLNRRTTVRASCTLEFPYWYFPFTTERSTSNIPALRIPNPISTNSVLLNFFEVLAFLLTVDSRLRRQIKPATLWCMSSDWNLILHIVFFIPLSLCCVSLFPCCLLYVLI